MLTKTPSDRLSEALVKFEELRRDMMLSIIFTGEKHHRRLIIEGKLRELEPDSAELKEPTQLKAALELRAYEKFRTGFFGGLTMHKIIDSLIEEGLFDQYRNLLNQQENTNGSN